jgi:serine/threonine protein kinase
MDEQEMQSFIYQITQGFLFLEKNNIVHRDVKPDNILIKDGIYKIGDYGFARIVDWENEMKISTPGT